MRKIGNTNSNLYFNPRNTQPPIPVDVDETDAAIERFIRQKYEEKAYMPGATPKPPVAPMNTGGTASSDDNPPPPPPKPRRFGFGLRSTSSAFPLGRSHDAGDSSKRGVNLPPIQVRKSSKVIGASIGVTKGEQGLEWKLLQLKEMGFADEQKNSNILKGLNGDLERTIESLVRLGEGSRPASIRTPVSSQIPSRQHTPSLPFSAGARVVSAQNTPSQASQRSPLASARSTNPFDVPTSARMAQTAEQAFESSFQNMTISPQQPQQTSQPLFPNATGGYQTYQSQQINQQPPMSPPISQMPQQYANLNNPFTTQTHNPFFQTPQQSSFSPGAANPYFSTPPPLPPPPPQQQQQQQATPLTNPFLNQNLNSMVLSPSQTQFVQPQPQLQQAPQSWMHSPQTILLQQQQQQLLQSPTQVINQQPFAPTVQPSIYAQQSPSGPMSPLNLQSPYQQLPPLSAQSTGRINKSSILALYNYPQLAPLPPTASGSLTASSQDSSHNTSGPSPQPRPAQLPPGVGMAPQRSVTMPVLAAGNRNPFMSASSGQPPSTATQPSGPWHASRESSESGRHSPDAFASLSARFVR